MATRNRQIDLSTDKRKFAPKKSKSPEPKPEPTPPLGTASDPVIVAAVNSCIDFDKLSNLPPGFVDRFRCLTKYNRVKAVCFFDNCGFGLKVYNDHEKFNDIKTDDGDEIEGEELRINPKEDGRFDLAGYWLRCPPDMYTSIPVPEFLVMDKKAQLFVHKDTLLEKPKPTQADTDSEDEDSEEEEFKIVPIWTKNRDEAMRFKESYKASQLIRKLDAGGIVVDA